MTDGQTSPRTPALRRLSEEEIELWLTVASNVVARPGSRLPPRLAARPVASPPGAGAPLAPGEGPVMPRVERGRAPSVPPLAPLERKLRQRLSRGRATAEAALDLHGLRQDAARSALQRFLAAAQRDELRIVLVVTGKGDRRASPQADERDIGVLRRMVPLWLSAPELRPVVLGYEEAALSHGGSGALYVRLRRLRA